RAPGVVHEVETKLPDEVDVVVVERLQRPPLRGVVDYDDRQRDHDGEGRDGPGARPGQRRLKPPLLHCTQSAAHGIALSRSFGIAWPQRSQMPYVPRSSFSRATSISSTADIACADSARSRSRSTFIVSPWPDSSSNCTSPGSRSRASSSASSRSAPAWRM